MKESQTKTRTNQYVTRFFNPNVEHQRQDGEDYLEFSFSSDIPYDFGMFIETLEHRKNSVDLSQLNDRAPVLKDHRNEVDSIVGVVEKARIDTTTRKGRCRVKMSQHVPNVEQYLAMIDEGTLGNISVRYRILEEERTKDEATGKAHYIVKRWMPVEVSLVGVPADNSVGIGRNIEGENERSKLTNKGNITMNNKKKGKDSPDASSTDAKTLIAYGKRFSQFGGVELATEAIENGESLATLQGKITARHEAELAKQEERQKHTSVKDVKPDANAIEWRSDFVEADGRDVSVIRWEQAIERERAITQAGGGTIPTSTEASGLSRPWFKEPDRSVGLLMAADVRYADSIEGDKFYLGEFTLANGFQAENTLDVDRAQQGGLNEVSVNVDTKVLQIRVSKASNQDVSGLEDSIMDAIMEYGFSDMESALVNVASGALVTKEVATGAATALPNANAIVGKLAAMLGMLKSAYARRASVMVSKEVFALLVESTQGNGSNLNYDIENDVMQFNGHPVLRSDHLADGNAANEISAVVGDLSQLVLGVRSDTGTERFPLQGFTDYLGYLRRGAGVKDASGLVKLITKA